MKPFLFLICLVFFKLNAQYQIDSAKTPYVHHTKSYKCMLKLRTPFHHSLTYKGYIYSIDSTQIIVCKKPPHLINHENLKRVKFVKFFPENIDVIKLRKGNISKKSFLFASLVGILPGILIASDDPRFKKNGMGASNNGLPLLLGIAYTVFMTPIYYGASVIYLSNNYDSFDINGIYKNYCIQMKRIKQFPHF